MSKRGSESICLLCQHGLRPRFSAHPKQPSAIVRKLNSNAQKATESRKGGDDGAPNKPHARVRLAFAPVELQQQLELPSAADVLRRVMLGPSAPNRSRSVKQRISQHIFKTSRDGGAMRMRMRPALGRLRNPDGLDGAMVEEATELVRFQINSCKNQEEMALVLAVALGSQNASNAGKKAKLLANKNLHATFKKKLAGMDPKGNMEFVGLLISRLEAHGHEVSLGLLYEALKAAAVTHSFTAFRRYFEMWQDRNEAAGNKLEKRPFQRLLHLLRQGFESEPLSTTTRSRQALQQILYGSTDLSSQKYNISNHLPADEIPLLGPWLALLADSHAGDQIWDEWQLASKGSRWRQPSSNRTPKHAFETNRAGLFILALFHVGQPHRAWQVFHAVDHAVDLTLPAQRKPSSNVAGIDSSVWDALLAHPSAKPATLGASAQRALDQALLLRLEALLLNIERKLQVTWHGARTGDTDEHGFHAAIRPEAGAETGKEPDWAAALQHHDVVASFDRLAARLFTPALSTASGSASHPSRRRPDALDYAVAASERASRTADRDVLDTLFASVRARAGKGDAESDGKTNGSCSSSSPPFSDA